MGSSDKKTWIENGLTDSEAWNDLGGKAPHVLIEFFKKRRTKNMGTKTNPDYVALNEQSLEFTYSEAKKKGFTMRMFTYAVDSLIEHGFIDIVQYGGGLEHKKTIYGLSRRWKKFGQPDFKPFERVKNRRGFCTESLRHTPEKKEDKP